MPEIHPGHSNAENAVTQASGLKRRREEADSKRTLTVLPV